jgi:hypothetical protein
MTDRITGLERLAQLKAEGVLTEEEFTAQKAALLGASGANAGGSQAATFADRFREGREKSKGVRRFIRWFFGIQLVAILLIGTYFLTRGAHLEETKQAESAAPAAPAQAQAQHADFLFTDKILASPTRDTWESLGAHPETSAFCAGSKAALTNATSKPLHIQAGVQESDFSWVVGTVQPNATITFEVGNEPGSYFIADMDDDQPLAPYELVKCNAAGEPQ